MEYIYFYHHLPPQQPFKLELHQHQPPYVYHPHPHQHQHPVYASSHPVWVPGFCAACARPRASAWPLRVSVTASAPPGERCYCCLLLAVVVRTSGRSLVLALGGRDGRERAQDLEEHRLGQGCVRGPAPLMVVVVVVDAFRMKDWESSVARRCSY